jgi:subtilase family serine protease
MFMKPAKLFSIAVSAILWCLGLSTALPAQSAVQYTIPNSKLGFVATAPDLGPEDASKQITIYVWLQLRNAQSFRETVEQLYEPTSATYQNWLTPDQFNNNFAPSADDVATVKSYLTNHGLSVLSTGERNLYVKAQGTIGQVESAFAVQEHKYNVRGKMYRANTNDPVMEGPAGAIVVRVGGLSDYHLDSHAVRAVDPATRKAVPEQPVSKASPNGAFFSPLCLEGVDVENFTTDGSSPKATYVGNAYGAPITNTAPGTLAPCGYQPSDLQTAYNFNALYKAGLNGTGQTVVIVDAWGSPTIKTDAATFTAFYSLPALNLTVYPLGAACVPDTTTMTTEADCQSWGTETSLDVESAHSVAPGANIALVEAASDFDDDLDAGILYAIDHQLGNVISNSYGGPESLVGLPENDPYDTTLMIAAAQGIAVNFSSGDFGDWSTVEGFTDVSYPASSPWATGVGGTSLFLNKNGSLGFQTGWGTNFTLLTNPPDAKGFTTPLIPPDTSASDGLGFNFGSGGGRSGVFRKPRFQDDLPGRFRLVPDISYLGDPETGVEIFCTGSSCFNSDPQNIYIGLVGGTSLACPMFSSLWAIVEENAGHRLGQPARSIYTLPSNAISDIRPEGSPLDAAGVITFGRQSFFIGPYQLMQPETPTPFLSALFEGGDGSWLAVSFGTDTSLSTNFGWDNVTGLGTPNALQFVNAFAPPKHK